jgi:hypothetical protein
MTITHLLSIAGSLLMLLTAAGLIWGELAYAWERMTRMAGEGLEPVAMHTASGRRAAYAGNVVVMAPGAISVRTDWPQVDRPLMTPSEWRAAA